MNEADPENNIFLVEKLLNRRWRKNRPEYLVKWMGYPNSENTWEPKSNINPRLIEQYDAQHGGPLAEPSTTKVPKVTPTKRPAETITSPAQRGRARAPPRSIRDEEQWAWVSHKIQTHSNSQLILVYLTQSINQSMFLVVYPRQSRSLQFENRLRSAKSSALQQREELPTTRTRSRRRRTGGGDAASETNTSTASVDESIPSSVQQETEPEAPRSKRARIVEEKPKETTEETSNIEAQKTEEADETVVTEVRVESIVEIAPEEPTFSTASSALVDDEANLPTIDLTEETPSPNPMSDKQPGVIYEYEQAEVETVNPQGSSTLITERVVIKTPDETNANTVQQEETFETVSYVVEDEEQPQIIQIHETSSSADVMGNNGNFSMDRDGSGIQSGDHKQSEEYNETSSASDARRTNANWNVITEVSVNNSNVTITEI